MTVLGADPDAPQRDWPEYKVEGRLPVSRPVWDLVSYFSYHPGMKMSQRNDDTDKMILGRTLSRRLDQGYTFDSVKGMIDRFYQSWGREYKLPALAFVSKQMQEKLTQEADVVKDDSILKWMLLGMPDRGPFDNPKDMRKAIVLAGDSVNRYPDVVADILRIEGTYEITVQRLKFLDEAIAAKLIGKPFKDVWGHTFLPPEIVGPGPLRPRFDTVQAAIAAIPINKESW